MKKYTLIVKDGSVLPMDILLEDRPIVGDFITVNKITCEVAKVAFDIDGDKSYVIANLTVDNR